MNSNERLNLLEQDSGHLTGWEEVAAMADRMLSKESTNNLVDEDEDEDDIDGMVDASGRKYQASFERAESIRFTDADGRVYRVEKARDQAKKIEGDNIEMLKTLNESLGLKAGSEVQLLKREVAGRGAPPIQEGELKMGKLTTNGISLDGVEMITDDGRRLKTSFVDTIYREWKTFYIDTATSTYEVIPVRS